MVSISLCMIVKNEADVLDDCLKSVIEICDEVIIVDTGSTDTTKDIAQKYTHKIYDFQWIDDFSAARNDAFSLATKDYILWLDADDILLKEDQQKLLALKKSLDYSIDSVTMNYVLSFDENNNPSFYFRRNRMVKRSRHFMWKGAVHEYLEVGGKIINADIAVVHRKHHDDQSPSNRNLNIYENRLKKGEQFTPRDLFYYANELKDHQKYQKALQFYEQFLQTKRGWIEDRIRAYLYLADIYRVMKKEEEEMTCLVKTFTLDSPRPEACCLIGDIFQQKEHYKAAINWYLYAVDNPQIEPQGFHYQAFSTWYPHLSLCRCYWKSGHKEKAIKHNDSAGTYKPNDPGFLYNRDFFRRI